MTFDSVRSNSPSVFNAGLPVIAYEDAENPTTHTASSAGRGSRRRLR
jgi:hypothetical protein